MDIPDNQIEQIYPTFNDISLIDYDGINSSEENFTKNLYNRNPRNYVLPNLLGDGTDDVECGFHVTDGGGLNASITTGRAYISGRVVQLLDSYVIPDLVMTDGMDNYIHLKLNMTVTPNTVDATPSATFVISPVAFDVEEPKIGDSVLLAIVRVQSGSITSIRDRRPSPKEEIMDDMKFNVKMDASGSGNEEFIIWDTIIPTLAAGEAEAALNAYNPFIKDTINDVDDERVWKSLQAPNWVAPQFSFGGWIAIGFEDTGGNAEGTISYNIRLYLRGGDGVVSVVPASVSNTLNWYFTEDRGKVIEMAYISFDVTNSDFDNFYQGRQLQYALSIEITGTGGDTATLPLVFQTYPDFKEDTNGGEPMIESAEVTGSRPSIEDFTYWKTDRSWRIKNTQTNF